MPADYRPCDVGYSRVGFWVQDFDQTLERLAALGTPPLTAPVGKAGERRACVRNPEGVFIEVMEDDPLRGRTRDARPDCRVAARSVTLSVPDLEKSKRYFMGALGMPESTAALRRPEHEALWGLDGATTRSVVLDAGNVLVELVQYLDPVGKPWPEGHRISDQGILNIAFGYRRMRDMMDSYRRSRSAGARAQWLSAARRQLGRRVRERRAGIQRGTAVGESALGRADGVRAAAAREAAAAGHASRRTHR